MKKYRYVTIVNIGLALCLFSCKKENNRLTVQKPIVQLPDKITKNRTLKSDTVYTFISAVLVTEKAILTIEPGTVIKSQSALGGKGRSGYIAIDRGSKIMAEGTVDNPIIFTSGTPTGFRQHGDWGGLYIFGNAPISAYDDNTGGAATEMTLKLMGALFPSGGGNNPDDNSGVLKYVRIEFAGVNSAESYGLGCIGVGSGTVIENVQASYTQTSGFGFFGGTVNAKNLVAFNNRVAGFVYANGYKGKQQFIVSYKHPYFAATGAFTYSCDAVLILNDIQNNPVTQNTHPILSNLTVIGPYNNKGYNEALPWNAAINVNYGAAFTLKNSILMGMPKGGIKFSDDIAGQHLIARTSEFSYNLVHSNIYEDAFTIDPNNVFSIDQTTLNEYASANHNTAYNKPDEIKLNDPFKFELPELNPNIGSVALSGADFSGTDFQSFFSKVGFRGAFGTQNWMKTWTNFYPVNTTY